MGGRGFFKEMLNVQVGKWAWYDRLLKTNVSELHISCGNLPPQTFAWGQSEKIVIFMRKLSYCILMVIKVYVSLIYASQRSEFYLRRLYGGGDVAEIVKLLIKCVNPFVHI